MGMRMVQAPMQRLECLSCGGYMSEHVKDCPEGLMDEAFEKEFRCSCPKCGGTAAVDMDDTIQCRDCRTRFSRSVGPVANPDDPEKTFIHQVNPDEEWFEVVVLAPRGTGKFKTDKILEMLAERRKAWRARRREEKRAAREPKRRHARAAPCQICGPLYCRYAP